MLNENFCTVRILAKIKYCQFPIKLSGVVPKLYDLGIGLWSKRIETSERIGVGGLVGENGGNPFGYFPDTWRQTDKGFPRFST
jgi:hypothetical protein